jgi:dTDP-L-rhamnose 4-epimerase
MVFEDGQQTRDFLHVSDVVQANLLALDTDRADYEALNVGTGVATSVASVTSMLAEGLGKDIEPNIVGKFREGDIRHCVADISKAVDLLGFKPAVRLKDGIPQLLEWVKCQQVADRVSHATDELDARRLLR